MFLFKWVIPNSHPISFPTSHLPTRSEAYPLLVLARDRWIWGYPSVIFTMAMENPPFKFIGWLPINISYCVSEIIYNWWIFMGKSEMVLQKPPNKIKEIGAFCHVWFQTDSGHFSGEIWWDQAAVPGALLLREVPKWCTAEGGAILMGRTSHFDGGDVILSHGGRMGFNGL